MFPSGVWEGFWEQAGMGRQPMKQFELHFRPDGTIHGHGLLIVIDLKRRRAADADLAHLTGDERRVRGHTTASGENAFRRDHAAQVFG